MDAGCEGPVPNEHNNREKEKNMPILRRKCRFAEAKHRDVDLRQYEKLIKETINSTVPGKNPRVYRDHFSTDPLNHSESVLVGRALSKLPELKGYGKTVMIFRLFDGRACVCDDNDNEEKNRKKAKGGRKA